MLTRLYADNFLCMVNFTLKLSETNILLGPNGSGKTSVLRALRAIQALVSRGSKLSEVFETGCLTQFQNREIQHFELDLKLAEDEYRYVLKVQHDHVNRLVRVIQEQLFHDGKPIFRFMDGEIQLHRDDYSSGPTFPFDWSRSGVGAMHERAENRKLIHFKKAISDFIIIRPCPPYFESEARAEDEFLEPLMQNFTNWYRHAAQENMAENFELFTILRETIPGFRELKLSESGENVRTLKACFSQPDTENRPNCYGFGLLSDGQKLLVALYSLLFLSGNRRVSLFIDEPDNYLSPREIQPWLAELEERCGDTLEQAVVISHHPISIDYMAGASGRWFSRDGEGPARVTDTESLKPAVDGLTLSEMVTRGWER